MGEIETKSTYIANANDVISSLVVADGDGDGKRGTSSEP
jgi:hypothetical protein